MKFNYRERRKSMKSTKRLALSRRFSINNPKSRKTNVGDVVKAALKAANYIDRDGTSFIKIRLETASEEDLTEYSNYFTLKEIDLESNKYNLAFWVRSDTGKVYTFEELYKPGSGRRELLEWVGLAIRKLRCEDLCDSEIIKWFITPICVPGEISAKDVRDCLDNLDFEKALDNFSSVSFSGKKVIRPVDVVDNAKEFVALLAMTLPDDVDVSLDKAKTGFEFITEVKGTAVNKADHDGGLSRVQFQKVGEITRVRFK
ncbi:hypothetical protein [Pseudoalteromonas obscura]|uniref:Uncharacterized protein n=1 Tax=Pseudoalteromonas obscura TaxID=3048491 RepID=A0ABT7EK37_9GAMM|nr:hypothetical protein [Pseudoalteromonas sp. P94(2023)]MDK2595419.1 hypothetical protein [Pseudoalteromonas sp. P94(2023)]